MTAHSTRTFKSGNSVALRLPKALGIRAEQPMIIEQTGDILTIRRVQDPETVRRELASLVADLEAIGRPADGVQAREPFDFPDRIGL